MGDRGGILCHVSGAPGPESEIPYFERQKEECMKAIVCTKYGPPEALKMKEVEKPEPGNNEVLIKVSATSAHIGDTRIRRVDPFWVRFAFGLFKPRKNLILGMEVSGTVESLGRGVELYREGDRVFAFTGFGFGGYAEYICLPERVRRRKRGKKRAHCNNA